MKTKVSTITLIIFLLLKKKKKTASSFIFFFTTQISRKEKYHQMFLVLGVWTYCFKLSK